MKVLVQVVSHEQVVEELLSAMVNSIDRFSQDSSFDFKRVLIDKFEVPPTYEEAFDDACSSYWSRTNPHPSSEALRAVLMQCGFVDSMGYSHEKDTCLRYAAVLYRTGDFKHDAHWGAYLYLAMDAQTGPHQFMRFDCRETIGYEYERNGSPMGFDARRKLCKPDPFTLWWVLAMAQRAIAWECYPPVAPGIFDKFMNECRVFYRGLSQIDDMLKTLKGSGCSLAMPYNGRVELRYAWSYATLQSVRPSPYEGAGQYVQQLFAELPKKE